MSPLLYFGSCSHHVDYQSGDKSPHSKVATAPPVTIRSTYTYNREGSGINPSSRPTCDCLKSNARFNFWPSRKRPTSGDQGGLMKAKRWKRVDRLFHAALDLEREGGDRAAFLARACAGDEPLRLEVESLLSSHDQASGFIESPAADIAAESPGSGAMRVGARHEYRPLQDYRSPW